MMSCPVIPHQKSFTLIEHGWLTDTVRPVSKKEFLQHQQKSQSAFSINRIIKTLTVGMLGAMQVLQSTPTSSNGMQLSIPALSCYLWSQIPPALAQTTITPAPKLAPGPQGDEFQVNTSTTSHQAGAKVAALSGGGFVVTWQSFEQDGSKWGVYGQKYDATGRKIGIEFQVNSYTSSFQNDPSVAALSGGGFVVTWQSTDQDGSSWGIYGQRKEVADVLFAQAIEIRLYSDLKSSSINTKKIIKGIFE